MKIQVKSEQIMNALSSSSKIKILFDYESKGSKEVGIVERGGFCSPNVHLWQLTLQSFLSNISREIGIRPWYRRDFVINMSTGYISLGELGYYNCNGKDVNVNGIESQIMQDNTVSIYNTSIKIFPNECCVKKILEGDIKYDGFQIAVEKLAKCAKLSEDFKVNGIKYDGFLIDDKKRVCKPVVLSGVYEISSVCPGRRL